LGNISANIARKGNLLFAVHQREELAKVAHWSNQVNPQFHYYASRVRTHTHNTEVVQWF